jgi:hypothetical protein
MGGSGVPFIARRGCTVDLVHGGQSGSCWSAIGWTRQCCDVRGVLRQGQNRRRGVWRLLVTRMARARAWRSARATRPERGVHHGHVEEQKRERGRWRQRGAGSEGRHEARGFASEELCSPREGCRQGMPARCSTEFKALGQRGIWEFSSGGHVTCLSPIERDHVEHRERSGGG